MQCFQWRSLRIVYQSRFRTKGGSLLALNFDIHKFANGRSVIFRIPLLCAWTLGLFIGIFVARHVPPSIHTLMHTLTTIRMSIVGGVLILIFPLVFCSLVQHCRKYYLMIPAAFIQAYCHIFVTGCLYSAFSTGGWLIRWLFCFSSSLCNVLTLWCYFHVYDNFRYKKCLTCAFPVMILRV